MEKKTLFVHENFFIYALVFYIYTKIYKYIYIKKNRTQSVFMLE